MHISVAFVRAYHSVLREVGLPNEAIAPLPDDALAVIPWEEAKRRLNATLKYSQEPALGLIVGERLTVSALHVLGHLLLTAGTLREAAAQVSRFVPLVLAGAGFVLHEQGDEASYSITAPPLDEDAERFFIEVAMTVIVNVVCALRVSGEPPSRVELCHKTPPYRGEYQRVFGCPVHFEAKKNSLVFPRAILDEARRLPDDQLKQMLYERAERLLQQGGRGSDIVLRVRDILRSPTLERFDLGAAARELGMSQSTLRRRLSEHGAVFSELVDEVRRELACDALRSETYDIKELSSRLGFSEPRAFHRAFRRWTGTTPARFRAEHAARGL